MGVWTFYRVHRCPALSANPLWSSGSILASTVIFIQRLSLFTRWKSAPFEESLATKHGADHRSAMHMHELRSFRLQQPIIEHRNALNCFWVILVLASGCCVIRVCVGIRTPEAATSKGFYIVFDILQDSGAQQISWIHVPISMLFSA